VVVMIPQKARRRTVEIEIIYPEEIIITAK
jgi:hypothetical protein